MTDREQIWRAIDAHRLRVADLLDQLAPGEWEQPSLWSAGWTVRAVAPPPTLQQVTLRQSLPRFLRARGDLHRATHDAACQRAAGTTPAQLVAMLRGMVGSRRKNTGVTDREPLIDILVHGQDIAVPLGRHLDTPAAPAALALRRMWTMRWPRPFPATLVMKGYRVTATDALWSAGDGPEVRGPIGAILLVGAGRFVALPELSGPGAPDLTAHVTA
ncbi:maleylpyruvate isomerase family mycothiol-dependent enzyme [Micromonospora sp. CPCC 205371]|nr:maleylpyruvate isomerase family mycothiol-dependent enzyme [Micromonospora sp. CPCC 205371]